MLQKKNGVRDQRLLETTQLAHVTLSNHTFGQAVKFERLGNGSRWEAGLRCQCYAREPESWCECRKRVMRSHLIATNGLADRKNRSWYI